ncbi:MAG: hypothetical protein JNM85_04375 [Chthonomonas sp.]|nr:hypothetical protein [Chthonomonas sp.]
MDPGSSKIGMALVERVGEEKLDILWRKVCPVESVDEAVREAFSLRGPTLVVIGNGTKSSDLQRRLREELPGVALMVVDEHNTSHEARARYWVHNKRSGWRRLLPSTLQVPPEPIDDFVAVILAERVLLNA